MPVARDKVIAPYYITEELKEKLEPEITVINLNCGLPSYLCREREKTQPHPW